MAPRPKEKPVDPPSFWLVMPRENFTREVEKLFIAKRPPDSMAGVTLATALKQGTL